MFTEIHSIGVVNKFAVIMKELSIKEKAKRYDEAIKRAKNIVNSINVGLIGKDSFEAVFPELKEGDGEMIRNRIINYLKVDLEEHPAREKRINEMLAYLEKQGEQKPANWLQELEDKLANATPKQLAEWKEKYFKEEPAEQSDEDEQYITDTLNLLSFGCSSHSVGEVKDFLKSLKNRCTWKPSDVQMDAVKDAIDYLGGNTKIVRKHLMSLYDQLKKLRGK